jgi:hypothetical protein
MFSAMTFFIIIQSVILPNVVVQDVVAPKTFLPLLWQSEKSPIIGRFYSEGFTFYEDEI